MQVDTLLPQELSSISTAQQTENELNALQKGTLTDAAPRMPADHIQ